MDISTVSMIMSQSKVQQAASIAVIKMAMDTGKQTANQLNEMVKAINIDPNLGKNLDITI